jgi:glucose-1-phosphate adenylyltransferase
MDLLDSRIRKELFYSDVTIHTKLKDLPPPKCTNTAFIKNSIISDGCVISGRVLNSIVSRGVRVKSGASVENSILMQDSVVEEGAQIKFSILDKETLVRNEKRVIGRPEDLMVYEKGSVI